MVLPFRSNSVLASLPSRNLAAMEHMLEPVELKFGTVLYEPSKPMRHVYFPLDCLISADVGRKPTVVGSGHGR